MTTKGGSLNGAAAPSRDDNIHLAERTHAAQLCCLSLPHAPRRTSRTLYPRRHFGRKSPSFGAGWMQELVMNYVFAHSPCHPIDENLRQHKYVHHHATNNHIKCSPSARPPDYVVVFGEDDTSSPYSRCMYYVVQTSCLVRPTIPLRNIVFLEAHTQPHTHNQTISSTALLEA